MGTNCSIQGSGLRIAGLLLKQLPTCRIKLNNESEIEFGPLRCEGTLGIYGGKGN